jgi:hypothetical protein
MSSLTSQERVSPCVESSEHKERRDPTVKTLAPLSRISTGREEAVEELLVAFVYCEPKPVGWGEVK